MAGSAGVAPWIATSASTNACESAVKVAGVNPVGGVAPRRMIPSTRSIT